MILSPAELMTLRLLLKGSLSERESELIHRVAEEVSRQADEIKSLRLLLEQAQMMISAILPEKDPKDFVEMPPGIVPLEVVRPKTAEERGL